ncbi:MAG: alpha/beta hydrolase [Pseudomonadota bacterium]
MSNDGPPRIRVEFHAFLFVAGASPMGFLFHDVPLPSDVSPLAPDTSASPFAGTWLGRWGDVRNIVLIVEFVSDDGRADVVYAVADQPQAGRQGAWSRHQAERVGDAMRLIGKRMTVTFSLSPTGHLRAVYGDAEAFAILARRDIDNRDSGNIKWHTGANEFLQTDLEEDGKPVQLETVIFKPAGDGPFPLAVVNHGSTGMGDDPARFADTWVNDWFADRLVERGFLVAYPQRRGRGRSDGLYDEGFAVDRRDGYTCDAKRSLAGADRALEDITAAVNALCRRPDVRSDEPIVMAGQSRGGILSLVYAGMHPNRTRAVINFVGGWIGEGCETADQINQTLCLRGAKYPRKTLWLYGDKDAFYSMAHSRRNFAAFEGAGGIGEFLAASVDGENNGHWLMSVPPLWEASVDRYLSDSD